jgi:DNA-binding CsgD family transcriptional regulator
VRTDGRRGSHPRVAAELGLRPQSVDGALYALRRRLGVASTGEAARWLDAHQPGWRDEP